MLQTATPGRALPRAPAEYKRASMSIADVTASGIFEGYASVFGARDLGGDIVQRGAFHDTLESRGARNIKMLWQHDTAEPIGTWLSIVEDARGLRVRGQLNLALTRAREALALMRDGAVDGLSIGFRARRAIKDAGGRLLQKIDLWEISIVTFPMLPQARVTTVKRADATRVARKGRINREPPDERQPELPVEYLRARSAAAALRFELACRRAEAGRS